MKPASLETQVAGTHYKGLAIEPYQFVMQNDWDPLAFTILKRISRYKNKDGVTDLKKALHEIDIRADLVGPMNEPRTPLWDRMAIDDYANSNGMSDRERAALRLLAQWVYSGEPGMADMLRGALGEIIADLDGST
jgi:hypothetical protein